MRAFEYVLLEEVVPIGARLDLALEDLRDALALQLLLRCLKSGSAIYRSEIAIDLAHLARSPTSHSARLAGAYVPPSSDRCLSSLSLSLSLSLSRKCVRSLSDPALFRWQLQKDEPLSTLRAMSSSGSGRTASLRSSVDATPCRSRSPSAASGNAFSCDTVAHVACSTLLPQLSVASAIVVECVALCVSRPRSSPLARTPAQWNARLSTNRHSLTLLQSSHEHTTSSLWSGWVDEERCEQNEEQQQRRRVNRASLRERKMERKKYLRCHLLPM